MKSTGEMTKVFLGRVALLLLVFLPVGHAVAQTCVQPPSDLIGWWPGDGNANDIAGTNYGTLVGNPTFTPDMVGQAFSLDGIDDFVEIPDASALDVPGSLTVDAWIRLNTLPGVGSVNIVSKEDIFLNGDARFGDPGLSVNYNFHVLGDRLFFSLTFDAPAGFIGCDAGGCFVRGVTVLEAGVDYHVAGVYDDGTKTLSVYLNGILDGTATFSTTGKPRTNDQPIRIGRRHAVPFGDNTEFPGQIDEVELFNRALTGDEILAIANAGSAGKCKVVAIDIDIKPGSFPNSINPRSRGVIPVAILTTDIFDATTVDLTTVRFGPTGTEAAPVRFALEDVDGDGDTDVIAHFDTQETGVVCGNTSAFLTGETFGGQAIMGSDVINTVGCK